MIQLYIYIYILFQILSHYTGYYKLLNIVPVLYSRSLLL